MKLSFSTVVGVSLLVSLILATTYLFMKTENSTDQQFQIWKKKFNIVFESSLEQSYRKLVFFENVQKINKHNEDLTQTFKMGVNQFTMYTSSEFVNKFLKLIPNTQNILFENDQTDTIRAVQIDWVAGGAVTHVKNQGQCGAAGYFCAVGACEGLSKVADGVLITFSQQQLVDCSSAYGNQGCNGGLIDNSYKFIKDHGLVPMVDYPYTGRTGQCKIMNGTFKVKDFKHSSTCQELINQLAIQPIAVLVDATNWSTYASGVFSNCKTALNHGVVLVGATQTYWKAKNSWGTSWGQSGFIRLARGNTCGICSQASYPIK